MRVCSPKKGEVEMTVMGKEVSEMNYVLCFTNGKDETIHCRPNGNGEGGKERKVDRRPSAEMIGGDVTATRRVLDRGIVTTRPSKTRKEAIDGGER